CADEIPHHGSRRKRGGHDEVTARNETENIGFGRHDFNRAALDPSADAIDIRLGVDPCIRTLVLDQHSHAALSFATELLRGQDDFLERADAGRGTVIEPTESLLSDVLIADRGYVEDTYNDFPWVPILGRLGEMEHDRSHSMNLGLDAVAAQPVPKFRSPAP